MKDPLVVRCYLSQAAQYLERAIKSGSGEVLSRRDVLALRESIEKAQKIRARIVTDDEESLPTFRP